jgi:hypothetical protein
MKSKGGEKSGRRVHPSTDESIMTNRAQQSGCVVSQSLVAMESQLTLRRAFPHGARRATSALCLIGCSHLGTTTITYNILPSTGAVVYAYVQDIVYYDPV